MLVDSSWESARRGWPGILHMIGTTMHLQDLALLKLKYVDQGLYLQFFADCNPLPIEGKLVEGILEGGDIERLCQELWESCLDSLSEED